MKNLITQYKRKIDAINLKLKKDLEEYLKNFNYKIVSDNFEITELKSFKDLDSVFRRTGFYIILSDIPVEKNKCKFRLYKCQAIYRGHCYGVKTRIMSHLFNTAYNKYVKNKRPTVIYTVCLKMESGVNGINIDKKPYSNHRWFVITHKMIGSSQKLREQMEFAFDSVYGKPLKSLT